MKSLIRRAGGRRASAHYVLDVPEPPHRRAGVNVYPVLEEGNPSACFWFGLTFKEPGVWYWEIRGQSSLIGERASLPLTSGYERSWRRAQVVALEVLNSGEVALQQAQWRREDLGKMEW